ncbi:MAG: peptidoglycan-associated lipoprotein Pal [Desulfurivibrio sp.]|nr:peptidoglycan-associated lipoprotein Pal [Desulfurivibrio sp.]
MRKELKQYFTVAALVCMVALLTFGCSKQPVKVEPGAETARVESKADKVGPPTHTPWKPEDSWPGHSEEEMLTDTGYSDRDPAVREGRTSAPLLPVYFDFDRSNIRPDQQDRLTDNGDYLLDNMTVRVRVEGNTDDRGTREYNMALGERRAMSARKYLLDMGVAGDRLETISYGEERPISFAHDKEAWALNRRADFVITK